MQVAIIPEEIAEKLYLFDFYSLVIVGYWTLRLKKVECVSEQAAAAAFLVMDEKFMTAIKMEKGNLNNIYPLLRLKI